MVQRAETATMVVDARPCLRVRKGPGLRHGIVDCLPAGTEVTVITDEAVASDGYQWVARIDKGGGISWLALDYLREVSQGQPEAFRFANLPLKGGFSITQRFGANPANYARFRLPGHDGLDFAASFRSPIYAVAAGTVFQVRTTLGHNYGKHVRVAHVRAYRTIYAHLDQVHEDLREGRPVDAGQLIGWMGNTGNVRPRPTEARPHAGTHLHLGLKGPGSTWPYDLLDPYPFLDHLLEG